MFCNNCGKQVDDKAHYCFYCGKKLQHAQDQEFYSHGLANPEVGFSRPDTDYIKPTVNTAFIDNNTQLHPELLNTPQKSNFSKDSNLSKGSYLTKDSYFSNDSIFSKDSNLSINSDLSINSNLSNDNYFSKDSNLSNDSYFSKDSNLSQDSYLFKDSYLTDVSDLNKESNLSTDNNRMIINKLMKRNRLTHRKLIIGITALLLILLGVMLFLRHQENSSIYTFVSKNVIEIYSSESEGETYVYNTSGDLLHTVPEALGVIYSADKSSALLHGVDYYYVNSEVMIKLRNNIYDYSLSENGKYLIYAAGDSQTNSDLCLYDVKKRKETNLNHVEKRGHGILSVSSDGKNITYSIIDTFGLDENQRELKTKAYMIKNGGKPRFIGDNMLIVKYVEATGCAYYFSYDEGNVLTFNVIKDKTPVKLTDNFGFNNFSFNKGSSELLLIEDGSTYISIRGKEKMLVANTSFSGLITPSRTNISTNMYGITSYGIQTFKNKVFLDQDRKLWFINDKYQAEEIGVADNNEDIYLSKDGNTLLYKTMFREIIQVSNLTGYPATDTIAENIDEFIVSDDLSETYFTTNNDLYYKKNGQLPLLVCQEVSDLCWNTDRTAALFKAGAFVSDRALYYSRNGQEPIAFPDRGEMIRLEEWNYGTAFLKETEDGLRVYYNTSGVEMRLIHDETDSKN